MIDKNIRIKVELSKPKFSENMLHKVNPNLRSYIKNIQKKMTEYDPNEFMTLINNLVANQDLMVNRDPPKNIVYNQNGAFQNSMSNSTTYGFEGYNNQNFDQCLNFNAGNQNYTERNNDIRISNNNRFNNEGNLEAPIDQMFNYVDSTNCIKNGPNNGQNLTKANIGSNNYYEKNLEYYTNSNNMDTNLESSRNNYCYPSPNYSYQQMDPGYQYSLINYSNFHNNSNFENNGQLNNSSNYYINEDITNQENYTPGLIEHVNNDLNLDEHNNETQANQEYNYDNKNHFYHNQNNTQNSFIQNPDFQLQRNGQFCMDQQQEIYYGENNNYQTYQQNDLN